MTMRRPKRYEIIRNNEDGTVTRAYKGNHAALSVGKCADGRVIIGNWVECGGEYAVWAQTEYMPSDGKGELVHHFANPLSTRETRQYRRSSLCGPQGVLPR